jgi:hypothetical protein
MRNLSIGGYLEFELRNNSMFHENAINVNSGRNALRFLIRIKNIKKIKIPFYICDAVRDVLVEENVSFTHYGINSELLPNADFTEDDCVLFVNYFGLLDNKLYDIIKQTKNPIVDNSQAFFSTTFSDCDSFYSPRKFFGVPDGGILLTKCDNRCNLSLDVSFSRCMHLLKRADLSAEEGFGDYQKNENLISTLPLCLMSNLTEKILKNIDYGYVKQKRIDNFNYLHEQLHGINELIIENGKCCPLVYPLLINNNSIRDLLIENKIYCAKYWDDVVKYCDDSMFEYLLSNKLIALPIDQRYSLEHMELIVKNIKSNLRR